MQDLTTTITVNGAAGDRFLTRLASYRAPLPRALHWLLEADRRTIEVDAKDAEAVQQFVDELIDAKWLESSEPPLLFSPRVGDEVVFRREALVEVARMMAGTPPTWRALPAGARGKLLGWRDRPDEDTRAVIDIAGADKRLVVFVKEHSVTRAPRN